MSCRLPPIWPICAPWSRGETQFDRGMAPSTKGGATLIQDDNRNLFVGYRVERGDIGIPFPDGRERLRPV